MSDVGYITLEYLTYLALASVFAAILFVGTTMVLVGKEIAAVFVHKFMHDPRPSLQSIAERLALTWKQKRSDTRPMEVN